MAGTESLNLPRLLEQAEAAYRTQAGRLPPADGEVPARRAGRLSSFVQLSLDEPEAMRRMQEAAGELRDCPQLDELLPKVLDGALALTGADFGNVRLVNPASGALRIVTQSGFGSEFTDDLAVVVDGHSACGEMSRKYAQMVVADVTAEPDCRPYREIAAAAGFRAVQSTPLADSDGRLVGMVSTHFREPGSPSARDLRIMELYGDLAGEAIARHLGSAAGGAAPRGAGSAGDNPQPRLQYLPAPPDTALAEFAGEIVHQLFAAGLSLASARAIIGDGAASDRVAVAIDELDRAIRDIRIMVFGRADLGQPPSGDPDW